MYHNQPVPYGVSSSETAFRPGTIFPSASRSESADLHGLGAGIYVSNPIQNPGARGVDIFVNATSSTAGTVTTKLQKWDPAAQAWVDLTSAATAALADPGAAYLEVYPGIAETANISVSEHLGPTWRVHCTVASAAVTFSVGASYLR